VELCGGDSYDPDGDAITYSWSIVTSPQGSVATLSNANSECTNLVPDVYGDFVIQLVVDDLWCASDPDTVTVSFDNVRPVAVCGDNQSVVQGDIVCVDGSESDDANGDLLTYSWSLVSRPDGSLAEFDDPMSAQTCFEADLPGQYIASLVVSDGLLNSDPCNVTIGAISYGDATTQTVQETITTINGLDDVVFKSRNMKKPLTNKLLAVLEKADKGLYDGALEKLQHDILGKTDGCAESGAPDKNDWIKDCDAQNEVYPLIMEAIGLLNNLI
jgi:hypothetical protein